MLPPIVDTVLWSTGALVWTVLGAFLVLYVLPALSGLLVLLAVWPLYFVASKMDSHYYDGTDDVKAAREAGTWYYYVIHYLFLAQKYGEDAFEVWMGFFEPYYDRLPLA